MNEPIIPDPGMKPNADGSSMIAKDAWEMATRHRIETAAGISCRFCKSNVVQDYAAEIKHAKNCPVLKAKTMQRNLGDACLLIVRLIRSLGAKHPVAAKAGEWLEGIGYYRSPLRADEGLHGGPAE